MNPDRLTYAFNPCGKESHELFLLRVKSALHADSTGSKKEMKR